MFRLVPVKKLSRQMTSWPVSSRRSQRWEPTKPAPPVTRTVLRSNMRPFVCMGLTRHVCSGVAHRPGNSRTATALWVKQLTQTHMNADPGGERGSVSDRLSALLCQWIGASHIPHTHDACVFTPGCFVH